MNSTRSLAQEIEFKEVVVVDRNGVVGVASTTPKVSLGTSITSLVGAGADCCSVISN